LNFEEANFDGLDDPFTKDKVKKAIDQMPRDKAPDPDGFTGAFFKKPLGNNQNQCYASYQPLRRPPSCQSSLAKLGQHCPFSKESYDSVHFIFSSN
jgi:hypothetical protein